MDTSIDLDYASDLTKSVKSVLEEFDKMCIDRQGKTVTKEMLEQVNQMTIDILTLCCEGDMRLERLKGKFEMLKELHDEKKGEIEKMQEKLVTTKERYGERFQTYARQTADMIAGVDKEEFTIMINPVGEAPPATIKEHLKEMSKRESWPKPSDVIVTREKGVILKFKEKEDAEKIVGDIGRDSIAKKMMESKLTKDRKNKLIIFGISTDTTDDEFKEQMEDLEGMDGKKINITKTFQGKDGNKNYIIDVDRVTKNILLARPRVCINFNRVRIQDYVTITRCFRCQAFGHTSYRCAELIKCGKCAADHDTKECKSSVVKCANCEDSEHSAFSPKCPEFQKYKKDLISKRL